MTVLNPKKTLAYSELTERVYWIDGHGKKTDVTQQFFAMLLLWGAKETAKKGQKWERRLNSNKGTKWRIVMERTK